ncbi:MAG: preprotein translocase subunit SecA [Chitinophagales bacterium]|jgi:preprotein translocase subunit SecA|nr:preprotein translocase subunit SecA [Sphingobacteriales bacterium]
MLNLISKSLTKIMGGSKQDKDVKAAAPLVVKINEVFQTLSGLSNDQLRGKTTEFKKRIADYVSELDTAMAELRKNATEEEDTFQKEKYLNKIDELVKEKDQHLEEVLMEILPEAFAVVKETARRFSENTNLTLTANELDKELAVSKGHVTIQGNQATYQNHWKAAGNEVHWNMVHYDVQLIGGISLHQGKIAEMATGEGKTLVATLPVYLNALTGLGVHIVTVNDYLALRDSEWNAPIFNFLGLRVDCIDQTPPNSDRRKLAYNSDITYGTNNEFGFDYLRDNMVEFTEELVQKKHHYAIVDETDSVLIDDARTPLIISGRVDMTDKDEVLFNLLKPRIARIMDQQKQIVNKIFNEAKTLISEGDLSDTGGGMALLRAHRGLPRYTPLIRYLSEEGSKQILLKTEGRYLQDNQKDMPKVDEPLLFTIDEKNNSVSLTDRGIDMITTGGEEKDFFVIPDLGTEFGKVDKSESTPQEKLKKKNDIMQNFREKSERLHVVTQLLKAYTLFEKDIQYVVMDNKVKIVDENTGRIMDGRRYSDGLHQAIEAKENVKVEASSQTVATITLQNYFRMYHKLAGMTGTAETEAKEFWDIYKLDVVTVPSNKPLSRKDRNDLIYKTKREKYNAIIDQIIAYQEAGRPVLVGTTNVEVSELLSRLLTVRKIKHNVLNAKQHSREADIVAEAGKAGSVTIATNMAGRGTDIKISDEIKAIGGLAIIGSERHESRRIDRQLRGRAGRQGDPGESVFYVSLEDDLMRIFGSDRISKVMDTLGLKEGEVIESGLITKQIEKAQTKVEENHFGMRKRLLEYDDVMNAQRDVIYKRRRNALLGDRLQIDIENIIYNVIADIVQHNKTPLNYENFNIELLQYFGIESPISESDFSEKSANDLNNSLLHLIQENRKQTAHNLIQNIYPAFENIAKNQPHIINVILPIEVNGQEINIFCKLSEALATKGLSIPRDVEKSIVLSNIDDLWTKHLREMDELKQSVQNAVWEQKDPIVIYKKEAFDLFQKMIMNSNFMLAQLLVKYKLKEEQKEFKATTQVQHSSKVRDIQSNSAAFENEDYGANENDRMNPPKREPIRVENRVGRNDPCPCGSGKKYKNCHG